MAAHHEFILIETIVIVMGVATGMAYLFQWIRLPALLGYILTGVIIGPYLLGLIQDSALINAMAQIGILFLLFIVGLELSFTKLKQLRFHAPVAGVLQLGLTTLLLTGLLFISGVPPQLAFLLGSILSLSSTAIVLKSLEEAGETDTVHGRLILGILVIQDLSIIPLMTLVPALSSSFSANILTSVLGVLLKALLFVALAVWISFRLVPTLMDKLASTHSREIFTLSVVTIGLGMAFLTGFMGLSYEAGAFIAGLSLSGSVFSRQVVADSRPFRDVFAALFFVSVGLLVNVDFLLSHFPMVLLVTISLVLTKAMVTYGVVRGLRFPTKTAFWTACSLFQVGEFSFILLRRVMESASNLPNWQNVMGFWSPLLINAIVLSMFITPLVIHALPWFIYRFSSGQKALAAEKSNRAHHVSLPPETPPLEDFVLIAGYGPIAQNLVTVLSLQDLPFVIIEMNANTLKKLRQQGIAAHFGDVSHPDILKAAGIEKAKVLAITFPDIRTAEIALQHAKRLNPTVYCMVRARYRSDIQRLYALGADEVIYEEFEISVNFIFHTLHTLGHPVHSINHVIALLKEREQHALHEINLEEQPVFGRLSLLADTKIEWLEVGPNSLLVGKTLGTSELRQHTGVNVLSIVDAEGQHSLSPTPEYLFKPHDVLVVVGTIEQLHKLEMLVG